MLYSHPSKSLRFATATECTLKQLIRFKLYLSTSIVIITTTFTVNILIYSQLCVDSCNCAFFTICLWNLHTYNDTMSCRCLSMHICDGMDSLRCIERLIREMTLIRMKGCYNNYKATHISYKILSDKLTRDF